MGTVQMDLKDYDDLNRYRAAVTALMNLINENNTTPGLCICLWADDLKKIETTFGIKLLPDTVAAAEEAI
jgi:hypothetical protein